MADAESPHGAADGPNRRETVSLPVGGSRASLSLPADADEREAAAIATAVGAHLRDRSVAAADEGDEGTERADAWTVAARMKASGKRRWPDDVRRGEEWKAAARSF